MKSLKNEKGAITIIVLVSVLLFTTFLITSYMIISNKIKSQKEIIEETRKIYETETQEEAYSSFFSSIKTIPIYTNNQYLSIALGERILINQKYFTFTEDSSYVLMNDLEIEEDDLPQDWTAPEELFDDDENEGNINYNGHIVTVNYNDGTVVAYNGEFVLPKEYEIAKYIESTGTQYIDTEYITQVGTRMEISFEFNNIEGEQLNGVHWNSNGGFAVGVVPNINSRKFIALLGHNSVGLGNLDYSKHTATINIISSTEGKFSLDNETVSQTISYTSNGGNIILFGRKNGSNVDDLCKQRIYSCKIWNDEELVRNFIPCYRKSDGVIGMYDTRTKNFYTNKGRGTFNVSKYEKIYNNLEYLSVNGINEYTLMNNLTIYENELPENWIAPEEYFIYEDGRIDYNKHIVKIIYNNGEEVVFNGEIAINIPNEYTPVKYIESAGTQYIDTGYVAGIGTQMEIAFKFNNIGTEQLNGVHWNSNGGFAVGVVPNINSRKFIALLGHNSVGLGNLDYSKHTATINIISSTEGKFSLDNETVSQTISYTPNGSNIILFGRKNGSNVDDLCKQKIFRCKIWNNQQLVRDFIPCYRKTDGVIGMYDTVTQEFYTNAGTGTFTKGGDLK